DGFVLEAKKGKLKMVNVVTAKEVQNKNQIQSSVDENTTAFAEIAKAAAGMNGYKDLLDRNDELEIDLDELKEKVADKDETAFDSIKGVIKQAFESVDDEMLNKEEEGDLLEETYIADEINIADEIGKIADTDIPGKSDEEILKARAQRFVNILLTVETGKSLLAADKEFIKNCFSDDFLLNGTTKSMLMKDLGISTSMRKNQTDNDILIGFEQEELQLEKISDTAYLAGLKGTLVFGGGVTQSLDTMANGLNFGSNFQSYFASRLTYDDKLPIMLEKIDGDWLIVGNGVKVEDVCVRMQKLYFADSNEEKTAFWFSVNEASSLSINSISVTGPQISDELVLEKSPMYESEWYYMVGEGEDKVPGSYSQESWTNATHQPGDTYKFTVTYADSTTQEFSFAVPDHSDVSFVKNFEIELDDVQNSLTVNWSQSGLADFEYYRLNVYGPMYHEQIFKDKSDTSTQISLIGLQPNDTIQIVLETMTLRGIEQQYRVNYLVPDIQESELTEELVQNIVQNLNGGVQTIAKTAGDIPVPNLTSSVRGSGTDVSGFGFPEGTTFHQDFTIEGDDEGLQNIFSMPTESYGVGLKYLLARFFDADGNLIDYPFTADPAKMNIGALVDAELTNARAQLDIFYGDEETGGPLVSQDSDIQFEVSGDIEVTLDSETIGFEIAESESSCTVSGGDPTGDLAGSFHYDGTNQLLAGKQIFLTSATFDSNGLLSGTIMVDGTEYAKISVENDSVVLELTNSN
ncbi:MAG: hypothetical protein ACQETH_17730, partial [Candidatus Rifleibacteriota bacterium]